jgi:tryptophan-rich sensory protein
MGIAVYRVWAKPRSLERTRALVIYGIQLALNAVWTPVFFGLHNPLLGLVVIVSLLVMIATTIVYFWRIDRLASMLLAPYIAWVSFATALNAAIWILN